ncbi:MAG: PAS domain-containing protein [Rubrivivax sp.]|nr:PAS domain-containing protein [Rubrivivax sp.]
MDDLPVTEPSDGNGPLHAAALQTSASILALQRRAQQEQARTVALLTAVLESISDGLVAVNDGGAITAINPQAVAMLALPPAMVARARWAEVQAHVARLAHAPAGAESAPGPALFTRLDTLDELDMADGRVLQCQTKTPQVDGAPLGTLVMFRDVTARKANERARQQAQSETTRRLQEAEQSRQVLLSALEDQQQAEAAQRASEARFQASFNSAGIGMSLKAIDGRWLEVNAQMCTIVGYPAQALLQMTCEQITHPDDLPAHRVQVQRLLDGSASHFQMEKRYLHANGQPVWAHHTMAVVRDGDGRPQYFVVHVADISQRKALEQALSQSQARLQATLDALPDLMFEVGLDGRYHDYHALRTELLATPPEAFVGRLMSETLPQEAAAEAMAALNEASAKGFSSGHQMALDLPQGQRWFELSVARKPAVAEEGPRFIVLSRDVTERRQGEEALRRSLAEQAALLKEVHHRVKNNLQIVHSLLRLESGRSVQPETATVLRDMRSRIQSMALLHESIYRSGRFASVDLGDYLRQVATQAMRALQTQAGAVRLQLDLASTRLDLDQALPFGLLVNELISNSLKHGFPNGQGGEIRVVLQMVGGTLQLCVSDSGAGLPPDFEARRGKSLGLQLVADLVEQLGARLDIGPAPAAAFSVTFDPARPAQGKALR